MTHFRVIVTGSRSWKDFDAVTTALDEMARAARQAGYSGVTVVHGGAKGADTSAGLWASDRARCGWPVVAEVYAVAGEDWRRHGQRAGHLRNQRMVELGADVCLAFQNPCESEKCRRPRPHGTHGTADCIERCEAEGIRVVSFGPRPTTREDTNP
ncbi:DUF2493 domain-containing protein [Micromonosporaceae bacterium B7E4]